MVPGHETGADMAFDRIGKAWCGESRSVLAS